MAPGADTSGSLLPGWQPLTRPVRRVRRAGCPRSRSGPSHAVRCVCLSGRPRSWGQRWGVGGRTPAVWPWPYWWARWSASGGRWC